jgi:hypothetical protein
MMNYQKSYENIKKIYKKKKKKKKNLIWVCVNIALA